MDLEESFLLMNSDEHYGNTSNPVGRACDALGKHLPKMSKRELQASTEKVSSQSFVINSWLPCHNSA